MEVTLDADSNGNRQCNENCTGQKRTMVRTHHTKESKMRNRLSKLHYLMFFLSMAAMTGCGANNAGTSAAVSSTAGGVAAKLQWQSGTAGSAKSAARALASTIPTGVANIQFTVTGSGANGAIPVVKSTVAATSGQGQIGGVYPGTVAVAVKALDTTGAVLYEGFAVNVAVAAGATTDVGTITMAVPHVKTADQPCLTCHENTLDATGQNIVANFKGGQSSHYTTEGPVGDLANPAGTVPGCAGCHGTSHNTADPSALGSTRVAGSTVPVTSVGSTRCFDCHNYASVKTTVIANHDGYYVANATDCSKCHQMHNSTAGDMERKTWAQSRHGATDFAHIGGGGSANNCANRCHNAKGFIAAVNNPGVNVQGNLSAQADQMITCDACHTNAALGQLRSLPGTKATAFATYTTSTKGYQFAPNQVGFNPNKKAYYPDVAGSNLCIVCHSGTTEGTPGTTGSLGMSDPYFSGSAAAFNYLKANVVTPKTVITQHNMPAAAVMYVKFGFTNLSTGTNGAPTQAYLDSLTSDLDSATGKVTSTHRKFGTSAIVSDSHFSASNPAPANFLANGPCAVCHVSGSHSYKIDQGAINAVCSHCHTSENGNAITTAAAFSSYFVEPQKESYNNAIILGAMIVNQKVAAYNATPAGIAAPLQFGVGYNLPTAASQPMKLSFYKTLKVAGTPYNADGTMNANSAALVDFQNAAKALGYSSNGLCDATDLKFGKFMGALGNIAFFAKDQGGFAHARTYSRRLIYDSIDFLDDGSLNGSVSATAKATSLLAGIGSDFTTNPVAGLYTKGTAAYNTLNGSITAPATGTSESMLYLVGWSRSTGAWSAPERP
jgi:hypothetical protein